MSGPQLAHSQDHRSEDREAALQAAMSEPGRKGKTAAEGEGQTRRRKVPALVHGWRNLELLRQQVERLEGAIAQRDFRGARAGAETVRTIAPGLAGSIERAKREGADPAAVALLARHTEALRPRVEAALRKAPAPMRGLGIDVVEQEADERMATSWTDSLELAERSPQQREAARAHEGYEAALDHRISVNVRADKLLNAPAYLHHNMAELRGELGEFLGRHLASTGHARVELVPSPGAFLSRLLSALRPDDASACVTTLRGWLLPARLFEIVDGNRAIFEGAAQPSAEAEKPGDGIDYAAGPKGPAGWTPAVAAAVGAALLGELMQTLPRLCSRLTAATYDDEHAQAAMPSHQALDPSTPLELQVARAMLGGSAPTVRVLPAASALPDHSRVEGIDAMFAALEAASGQIETDLAVAHQLGEQSKGRSDYSALIMGNSLRARHAELRTEIAELHGQAIGATAIDGKRLQRLLTDVERLRTETDLVKKIAMVAQVFGAFDELTEEGWAQVGSLFESSFASQAREAMARMKASEQPATGADEAGEPGHLSEMERVRRGAAKLRGDLSTLHSKWLKLQQRLMALGDREAPLATAEIEAEMTQLRGKLTAVASDANVQEFLKHSQQVLKDARLRAFCAQLIVMTGVAVVTGGMGALAEGALVGAGAGAATAQLAGLAVETISFSAMSARLNGTPITQELTSNLFGNLATFGAMRATKGLISSSRMGKIIAAGSAEKGGAVYWAAHAGALTTHTVVTAGVQYAQMQIESLARQGRVLTVEEQLQLGVQGMAMMIGGAVIHHGMTSTMEHVMANGARMGSLFAKQRQIHALAKRVAAHGDPGEARQLLSELRVQLEAEHARWQELSKASEQELQAQGISKPMVDEMGVAANENLARLDQVQNAMPETVKPSELFQVGYRHNGSSKDAKSDGFRYDAATRTMTFEGEHDGVRRKFRTQLAEPILDLANKQQKNCIVGTRTFKDAASAENVLREVAAGNFAALEELGVSVPKSFRTVDGLEFGIGRLPNGERVIVKGDLGEVDWSTLPGVVAEAHVHPSTPGNDLDPNLHGEHAVLLEELLRPTEVASTARELVFPSAPDFQYVAEHQIQEHRVITPFILEKGLVKKPGHPRDGAARIEFVIHQASDTGRRSNDGGPLYRAEVSGTFDGVQIFRVEVYASQSDGLFLTRPDALLEK
jgi:hypothetical protein